MTQHVRKTINRFPDIIVLTSQTIFSCQKRFLLGVKTKNAESLDAGRRLPLCGHFMVGSVVDYG